MVTLVWRNPARGTLRVPLSALWELVASPRTDYGSEGSAAESVMSELADKLLAEAVKLTAQERARVAAELIASVDDEPDADADVARAQEIDVRVQRIETQGPKGEDWQTVHDRIAARLRSK
jgi:hypothetical protein